jgi:serine acetyltransferase
VIDANAVVTKPIPPYTVAARVPARVIDYFGPKGSEPEGFQPDPSEDISA